MAAANGSIANMLKQEDMDIKDLLSRIELAERGLRLKELTPEERGRLEGDLQAMKDSITALRQDLISIQAQTWRSSFLSFLLIMACFLVYSIYVLFFRNKVEE